MGGQHLGGDAYRRRVVELMAAIEAETLRHHQTAGSAPTGAAFLIERKPTRPPRSSGSFASPALPRREQGGPEGAVRKALRNAYALFYAAFRQAADRLARGDLTVAFPVGSFPPARAFVVA